jgi:hypothetical protein
VNRGSVFFLKQGGITGMKAGMSEEKRDDENYKGTAAAIPPWKRGRSYPSSLDVA